MSNTNAGDQAAIFDRYRAACASLEIEPVPDFSDESLSLVAAEVERIRGLPQGVLWFWSVGGIAFLARGPGAEPTIVSHGTSDAEALVYALEAEVSRRMSEA